MSDVDFDKLIKSITKKDKQQKSLPIPTINKIQNCITLPPRPHKIICLTPKTTSNKDKNILPPTEHWNHLTINHMFNEHGQRQSLDQLLKSNSKEIWKTALSNELGQLAQGICHIKGNDVIDFIPFHMVPKNKIVTYANMVCNVRPLKSEKFRVRLTVGGDRLQYLDDTASPAASLLEAKLLFNSTISQSAKGARFIMIDIKDFFLQTIMSNAEYMKIHNKYFLQDIRQKYQIDKLVHSDGYIYCKIKKGMYGLK